MYLVDTEIRGLLDRMRIEAANPEHPFVAEDQVQPCSIDLRLDRVFWKPVPGASIDLRRSQLMELSPRRYWKRLELEAQDCVKLAPGDLVLGRIYEKFSIPHTCAGKIEGRSSFARMGLAVHCTGDFINPGYRGHMPLQLTNNGSHTLKVFPYIPICQLKLIGLSDTPERVYGERELQSIYMDDDGGPSYWWRDKRIKHLQETLGNLSIQRRMEEELLERVGIQEPEVLERFEDFVSDLQVDQADNVDTVLEYFAETEDKSRLEAQIVRACLRGIFPLLLASSVASLFARPVGVVHIVVWVLTLMSIPVAVYGWRYQLGQFLGKRELHHLRMDGRSGN